MSVDLPVQFVINPSDNVTVFRMSKDENVTGLFCNWKI